MFLLIIGCGKTFKYLPDERTNNQEICILNRMKTTFDFDVSFLVFLSAKIVYYTKYKTHTINIYLYTSKKSLLISSTVY